MTAFQNKSFTVGGSSKAYRDNLDRVFGKKEEAPEGVPDAIAVTDSAVIPDAIPQECGCGLCDTENCAVKEK